MTPAPHSDTPAGRSHTPAPPPSERGPHPLRRLVQQSGLYALGNVVVKASGLLLAPLYLNLLTEQQFGYFALLDVTARVVITVGGLGLAAGLLRVLTRHTDPEEHAAVPLTALALATGAALLWGGLLWMAAPALARLLLDDGAMAWTVRLMGLYAAAKVVQSVPLMLMRARERAGLFLGATFTELALLTGGVVWLLGHLNRGVQGIMEAYLLAAAGSTALLVGAMLWRIRWRLRRALAAPLLRFGVPLAFAALAALVLNLGDRYMLKALADAGTVGVYDWAGRLGGVINMLFVQSFHMAFNVIGLKVLGPEGDGRAVYRRVFRHYVVWTGWGVVGLSLLALDVTMLLSERPAYQAVDTLILPIALGFLLYGLYYIVANILYAVGNSRAIAVVVVGAAVANLLLNAVFIPWLGALGAALTTTAAYGLLLLFTLRAAQRHLHVDYAWGKLIRVVLLILVLVSLGRLGADAPPLVRLAWRGGLILAYLPLLLLMRLYTLAEIRVGVARMRDQWRAFRREAA
ncbi:hypothetical protein AWN76_007340 [Rhodothermaceae bacterium RA]|nr:hypothetical protein AWN76_007340 [Rhodothermaceae bacterium RA]